METEEKILRGALSLFFRFGIRQVTMDQIARELGISKKTIYQHYREKDDLVKRLCEIEMDRHERDFDQLGKEAKDPIHEIMLIAAKMRAMMQRINPVFFSDLKKFHSAAYERFQKFRDECGFRNIVANIRKGMEEQVYREDLDPAFVARYRLAQVEMLMFGDFFDGQHFNLVSAHEMMMDMFVHGIATPKGQKLIAKYKSIQKKEKEQTQ